MDAAVNDIQGALEERRFLRAHGLEGMPSHEETVHRLLELGDAVFELAEALQLCLVEDSHGRWSVLPKEVL